MGRIALLSMVIMTMSANADAQTKESNPIVLVIHGGAGTLLRENMTAEMERGYLQSLEGALKVGFAVLQKGASSLDAVEAVIRVLEDDPLFNAGKGAVFTHDGRNELDASIMDGKTKMAGAVAAVTIVKHPISAARAVMEKSPHVMMTGKGAELFASEQGLEIVDPSYFWTEHRWKQLQKMLIQEAAKPQSPTSWKTVLSEDQKFGTVGAAALDKAGNLAAGTSTGGMTNKRFGRVGDSPIIGAGTYADNESCAVSGTGHGEYFIRYSVASEIGAIMKYKKVSVQEAADMVVQKTLKNAGGEGGVIALDRKGNFAFSFNSAGMYRGYITADGKPHAFIYK